MTKMMGGGGTERTLGEEELSELATSPEEGGFGQRRPEWLHPLLTHHRHPVARLLALLLLRRDNDVHIC
jgi:hypothetical protein